MLDIALNVIGPVAVVAVIGFVWGLARRPFDTVSFAMVATYVGTPCLVVDSLGASGLKLESLSAMGLGSLLCTLAALAAGYAVVRASRLPVSTYLPASTFANTGNIGLPLALFAFGRDGLALSIAYFAVHGVLSLTIGQALAVRRFSLVETLASRPEGRLHKPTASPIRLRRTSSSASGPGGRDTSRSSCRYGADGGARPNPCPRCRPAP